MNKRVFSGIQPTGAIHIGNYVAAISRWVKSQDRYDNIFCVVDLHAITVPQDPTVLRVKTRELAALLFAAGIDPAKSELFVQSSLGGLHCELAWILNCHTPMGWMQRMTQFKEKSEKRRAEVSVGLFDYPALMAADILLYDTDEVPVGADQKQHVELARDVAERFNSKYGDVFRVPEPVIPETGARVMGLDDPTKKMSKSIDRPGHAIGMLDSPDEIRAKIMKATTDSLGLIRFDEDRPGVNNLLVLYRELSGESAETIQEHFEGKGYAALKGDLADLVVDALSPIQESYTALIEDPELLDAKLGAAAERLRAIGSATLTRTKEAIGLRVS